VSSTGRRTSGLGSSARPSPSVRSSDRPAARTAAGPGGPEHGQQDREKHCLSGPGGGQEAAGDRARSGKRRGRQAEQRGNLTVRLSADERERIAAAAAAAGMTAGGFMAAAALAAAGQVDGPRSRAVHAAAAELAQARTQLQRYGTNVNQAVARLHSTGRHDGQLTAAAARADDAVGQVLEACRMVLRSLR
jgi:hypothetical protein